MGTQKKADRSPKSSRRDPASKPRRSKPPPGGSARADVELLSMAFDRAGVGLCLVGPDNRVMAANAGWLKSTGLAAEQVIGRSILDLFPDVRDLYASLHARVRSGETVVVRRHRVCLAGRETWWEGSVSPVPMAGGIGLLITALEVTSQVKAERELQQLLDEVKEASQRAVIAGVRQQELTETAERRAAELSAVIQAIPDGIAIFGPSGEVVRANDAARQILGLEIPGLQDLLPEAQVKKIGWETMDGRPVPYPETPQRRALRGESVASFRFKVRQPDGRERFCLASAAPIRDSEGRIIGAASSYSDVTRLMELQQVQQEIVSLVAHDLRQPLTAVQGQAQLVERSLDANRVEPAKRANRAVIVSAQRMVAMIEDLADSVRLEGGRLELSRVPIYLGRFLAELLTRSATSLDVGRVRLSVDKAMPPVLADPDRLERVFLNLVSNALKYSDPGTPVDLRVERRDNQALVSVKDRGRGIAPEDLPHIFERFYKPKGPSKKESIGLGLYISRMLVEAHSGRIWAESEPGRGSTFYFTLPMSQSASSD